MAKRRYSNSKKRKGRRTRGKKSRCTRHTKRHTRRRVHRGGYTPGPLTIPVPLRSTQLLSGINLQRGGGYSCQGGGFELSTGGYASNNGPEWKFLNTTCGRN